MGDVRQVPRARMADRDGGVGAGPSLHEQGRERLADDVAASHDNHVLAGRIVSGAEQNLLDAGRSAGQESGFALQHPALADGMETVHILARINSLDGVGLVQVSRQGQLYQYAVEGAICIEGVDEGGQLLLGGVVGQPESFGEDAHVFTGAALVAHVHLGSRVVTNQHGSQPRPDAGVGEQFRHVPGYFGAHGGGQLVAVEDSGSH